MLHWQGDYHCPVIESSEQSVMDMNNFQQERTPLVPVLMPVSVPVFSVVGESETDPSLSDT